MTNRRVYITGISALTSLGQDIHSIWAAILAGQIGIKEISRWDLSAWPFRLGGELKEFAPAKSLPDRKILKVISAQDAMGLYAGIKAIEDSQLIHYRETVADIESYNEQTAVFVGSPGNKYMQQYDFLPLLSKVHGDMRKFAEHLFTEVHPTWLLRILPNNVLAYTGITYGFKGPNHNVTNHAVGGMQALIEAYHAIKMGQAERAVVIAYDIGIEPQAIFYYGQLGVLSKTALKPFDVSHDGTILAEGAAAIVLESEASMQNRQAKPYAEMMGGKAKTESAGLFSLNPTGSELSDLLEETLQDYHIPPEKLGLIVAHGNGNVQSDDSEAAAIAQTFKAYDIPITAFKWAMGHTLCASGILDTVLTCMTLKEKKIPGLPHLTKVAPSCNFLNLSQATRSFDQGPYAMIINRGFASMNASVVIKACD